MRVAIVKYNAGNTGSVSNALNRLGIEPVITDAPAEITSADRVIFPGVGEASTAMTYLIETGLDQVFRSLKQPVLGICLGMQLLCEHSDENDTECLGIIPGNVKRFPDDRLKVPHMGWNTTNGMQGPLFDGVDEDTYFYFIHGYFVEATEAATARCTYGKGFTAAVQKDNFYGVQFHPEKSGAAGERLLANFLNL